MENLTGKKLLLVDDNADYRHSLRIFLELENYQVEEAVSVDDAIKRLGDSSYDILLLDVRLTNDVDDYDFSGMEVAKKARETKTPCIVVTGHSSVESVRISLNSRSGPSLAVDFVEKKAGPQAVLGAIQVVLGKSKEISENGCPDPDLEIDLTKGLVWFRGKQVNLPERQYRLIAHLCERKGAVAGHRDLIKAVYGEDMLEENEFGDSRIERLVERIRKKIEDDPAHPRHLIKVYARGYRLVLSGQTPDRNTPE